MKVTVYTTATCPYCVMVKRWLEEHKVEFEDKRVDQDQNAAREMIDLSGQMGVPFTTIEDDNGDTKGVLGFDVASLKVILNV